MVVKKFEDNDKKIAKYICVYLERKSIDLYRQHKNDKQDILGIEYDILKRFEARRERT